MSQLQNVANRVVFAAKKKSPELLIAAGAVAGLGALFFTARGAIKANDKLKERKKDIETIHTCKKIADAEPSVTDETLSDEFNVTEESVKEIRETYDDTCYKKDLVTTYGKIAVEMVTTFAPAIGLSVLSFGCFVGSNRILNKRNAALTAAYASLNQGYKHAKENLISEFGAEKALKLLNGIHSEEIEEVEVNEKTGKTKTVIKNHDVITDPSKICAYAEFFAATNPDGSHNPHWKNDNVLNMCWLRSAEAYLNDVLKAKGYLYLNEVWEYLGFGYRDDGQFIGWVANNPDGDGEIRFNLPTVRDAENQDMILVELNPDGNIWKMVGKMRKKTA